MMRILSVDDHEMVSDALTSELRARGFDAHACPVLEHEQVVQFAWELRPSVVLLDIDLGRGRSSLNLIEPLKETGARVVMLTASTDAIRLAQCLEAGAEGLLSKGGRIADLVAVIESAAGDGCPPHDAERDQLLARLARYRERVQESAAPFERLTPREQDVLAALVHGKSAQTIADETFTSIRTVRGHIQSVLDKLEVNSQVAAVAKAHDARWRPSLGQQPPA